MSSMNSVVPGSLKFIDLFAGLGGFHIALSRIGGECVFASEIDPTLRSIYEKNHGLLPNGDIKKVSPKDIPQHDVICAGFPCQPFSKAGGQEGFNHPIWGKLFLEVLGIIEYHLPQFVILENVPNLEKHDQGKTWKKIKDSLQSLGYFVDHKRLSPHQFGIPQIRERMFIVASRHSLEKFEWPKTNTQRDTLSILSTIESNPINARRLPKMVDDCLDVWQDFLNSMPNGVEIPYFPLWTMEWGADYPFENTTPHQLGADGLGEYCGSHGILLKDVEVEKRMASLPSHARTPQIEFPRWKKNYIRNNRNFYLANKEWIDPWLQKILNFPSSYQKLEWNAKGGEKDLSKYLIQFRASGVRIKRPSTSPSLISMNVTQVPIVGWERRYLSPRECLNLQSMGEIEFLPETPTAAFRAIGNAVNVDLVEMIAKNLISRNNSNAVPAAISPNTLVHSGA